ncbi:MAG TPA: cation:proton antiporter [Verrucomicrobiae bacterium]|nr:cation:proton antiporter [Verrucomicrobiae bacterium]
MNLNLFFALLGGLLVLAFVANRLVRFTGVPDVIILMATGVVIGPALHWVNPDVFRGATQGFGSLALILILFEGGLELKLREIINHFAGGLFLAIFSYALSVLGVALVCRHALHFAWIPSLLVGAALGCISSSIILPVLQQVNLRREVKVTLLVEATFGDALAVLAVTTLLDIAAGGSASAKFITWSLFASVILAVASGVLIGALWSYLLPLLSEERFWHVLTFGVVLLIYSGVHAVHGNELVAVLLFGLTLSNYPAAQKRLQLGDASESGDWFTETPVKQEHRGSLAKHHGQMLTFHGELAFLIRTFFFVLLGALVEFDGLRKHAVLALGCSGALFIARWLSVQSGRFAWRAFTSHERELMTWFLPRGLITAVLGIDVLEARGVDFAFLPSLAFAVILITNLALLIGSLRARQLFPELRIAAPESAVPEITS